MNHKNRRIRNRGYQPSAEAKVYPSENHPRPYRLMPKAITVLGKEKSHRQMVDETIDEFEVEQAEKELSKSDKLVILMDCGDRLHKRWLVAWDAHFAIPDNDVRRNDTFAKLKRITNASNRLNRKITWLLEN